MLPKTLAVLAVIAGTISFTIPAEARGGHGGWGGGGWGGGGYGVWGGGFGWPYYYSPDLNPLSRSYNPDAWKYFYKLNCMDAGRSLIGFGYRVVDKINCQGDIYSFVALKRGRTYKVVMDPWSGTIVSAKGLRN